MAWNWGMMQMHVEPLPTPLIKSKHNNKSDTYFVRLKLCRDPTSSSLDLYELSDLKEAPENVESDFDENKLY